MSKPTLSVVMANYNDSVYIGVALKAILAQSFPASEVIVVDDGSTDNSVEVIEGFIRGNPRVILLRNERNMGVHYSVNRGTQVAGGKYLYAASANDFVLPGFFEKSIGLLEQYPKAGLCCSDPAILHPSGRIIGERLHWSHEPRYFSPTDWSHAIRASWKRAGGGTSVLMRRSLLSEAGGMLSDLLCYCDWFAFHVVGFRHGVCYIPEALVAWRAMENSLASGVRSDANKEAVCHVLTRLKSPEYRDVLQLFYRSGALSILPGILRFLVCNPAYWDCLSPLLVLRVLPYEVRHFLSGITPPAVRHLYHTFRHETIGNLGANGDYRK